jgi:hypothetical protein
MGSISGSQLGASPVVFLRRGEEVFAARVGEVVAGNYRIESITATAVEFTFLPTKARQTLTLQP